MSMSVIGDYLNRYKTDYPLYQQLAATVVEECETALRIRGVKALVSSRVKRMESLNGKIFKIGRVRKIRRKEDLMREISDLAGIRIALYFPNDRETVADIISRHFKVVEQKQFPVDQHSPGYQKRFSGYWATHYRVKLKGIEKNDPFYNREAEIQVASLLMHAWAEIEHDMVYKPVNGKISTEEYAILDELNGLVLSGEIALERLKTAMEKRIKKENRFNDDDELASFIYENIENKSYENIGDTWILSQLLISLDSNNAVELKNYLMHIRYNTGESISDQLVNFVLFDYLIVNQHRVEPFFELLEQSYPGEDIEENIILFLNIWIILEKTVYQLKHESGQMNLSPYCDAADSVGFLRDSIELKQSLYDFIIEGKLIRQAIIHGNFSDSNTELRSKSELLFSVTKKIIKLIKSEDKRREWGDLLRSYIR